MYHHSSIYLLYYTILTYLLFPYCTNMCHRTLSHSEMRSPLAERVPPNKSAHNGAIKAAGATESAIDPTTLEKTRSNTKTPQEPLETRNIKITSLTSLDILPCSRAQKMM